MNQTFTIKDDETEFLAGSPVSSPARRAGHTEIIQFPFQARSAAASLALEDASSSDWDVPPTIGELAVRIVGQFDLPRLVVMTVKGEDEP